MTKLILNLTKIVLVLLSALFFGSCNFQIDGFKSVEGSGNVTTEVRSIAENFTAIDAATGLEVEVVQQDQTEVQVIADDNLHQHILIEVVNGVLEIKSDRSIKNEKSKKIIVGLPICDGLSTSSGASLNSKDKLKGPNIDLSTSSGSEIKVMLEYDEINGESSSGSSLDVSGLSLKSRFESSSGSSINAEELTSNDVFADASSGSEITLNAVLTLEAEASSGSSIKYVKSPEKGLTMKKSSGGDVSKM